MKDITPPAYRCSVGACPAIYQLEDVTPAGFKCAFWASCPAIYTMEDGRALVVGERATPDHLTELVAAGKIDTAREYAVIVPMGMLKALADGATEDSDV